MEVNLSHFACCVTDLDRSVRFYEELLGFSETKRMAIPDSPAADLLGLEAPLGMTAVYLTKDGATLELLHFGVEGNPPARPRPLNEPGLTHMSFFVEDLRAAVARAEELGGSPAPGQDVGTAVFIRDPDGQLIELIDLKMRHWL